MKRFLKYYGITFLVGSAIFIGIAAIGGLFSGTATELERLTAIANGSTAAGCLLLAAAGLAYVNHQGVFDGITYNWSNLTRNIIPGTGLIRPQQDYYEYVKTKHTEKPKTAHLIIIGLLFLTLSIVLSVIYVNLKG